MDSIPINSYYFFIIIACYLLACYGGGFATMPALAADSFGSQNIGRIYGTRLTSWGLAGIKCRINETKLRIKVK